MNAKLQPLLTFADWEGKTVATGNVPSRLKLALQGENARKAIADKDDLLFLLFPVYAKR